MTVPSALAASIIGHLRGYAIIGLAVDGTVTHWLGDAESITGYSAQDVLGRDFSILFTEADLAADVHRQEISNALTKGINEDCRWHCRKNGERFWGNGLTMRLGYADAVLMKIFRDETLVKQAEERRILLLNELNHRVRNTLATVQSVTEQTLRGSGIAPETKKALSDRLLALSRAHDVLVQENWAGADLGVLVHDATKPYERAPSPFVIDGPVVRLHPSQAVTLSLVLHELATNAVKHGALSSSEGSVHISWNVGVDGNGARTMTLLWRERGGPSVSAPTRTGFGTRLIRNALGGSNESANIEYKAAGLECSLCISLVESVDQNREAANNFG
jgi:PAS domain S-box-containing protein